MAVRMREADLRDAQRKGVLPGVPKRRSKYNARKTKRDGITFDSKKEADRWSFLRAEEKAGRIRSLQRQVEYRCFVEKKLITTYLADFRYYDCVRRRWTVEDVKGFRTKEYVIKKRLVEALFAIVIEEV